MIKVLVVETTKCGYDGITNVIKNYFLYQEDPEIQMDLVTINEAVPELKTFLEQKGRRNYQLPYRNRNPLKYVMKLRKILKEGGYQIIHVHGCSGTMAVEMLAAKLAGIKVRAAHAHSTACTHTTSDKILRPFFLKWCNCRYACSDAAGKWLYKGMPFSLISNGIDLEKFQYDPVVRERLRNEYDLEDKLVIGHVGRFCEEKNHKKILEIAKELHDGSVFLGDLVQEGNVSLMLALKESGEEEKILNAVREGIEAFQEEQRDVHVRDRKMVEKVDELDGQIKKLKEEMGRKITLEELALYTDRSEEELRSVLKLAGEEVEDANEEG